MGAFCLLLSGACGAMEFRLVGTTLVMSGPVVSDDLARLKDSLATGKAKLVVLHESPGGDLWNGLKLGEWIRDARLPTAVSGKCESACGLIYLGGVTRAFTDARPIDRTMVGLHGAHHRETKEVLTQQSYQIERFMRTMMDGKYPADLLERTLYPKNPGDFVYVFHPRRFAEGKRQGVMQCQLQPDAKFKCVMLEAMDALSVGVVTNPEILQLEPELRQSLAGGQP